MRRLLIFISFLILAGTVAAQPYFCAQANPDGTVNVIVHDAGGLNSQFQVFWSTDPLFVTSSSLSVMSGGIADFSIPIAAIDANAQRYYFKVAVTPPSGITTTYFFGMIYLEAVQLNLNDHDIVNLRWNSVSTIEPGTYLLQRFDNTVWKTIHTENGANAFWEYVDKVNYPHCDPAAYVQYRVLFTSDSYSGCSSISNTDLINAYEYLCLNPTVDSVSISMDPSQIAWLGHPIISWHSSGETDIESYYIQRFDGNAFPTIAVVGADQNFFVDMTQIGGNDISGCLDVYTYAIVAVDSCGNLSAGTYQVAQNNLKLNIKSFDACGKKAQLVWNRYHNMPGGLGGYKIYKRDDKGNNQLLETLSPGDTSFLDEGNFVNGDYYHYRVVAFNQSGSVTSGSCESTMQYQGPNAPDSIYIEYASIRNDRDVEIRFYLSPAKSATDVIVERADNSSNGHFATIFTYHLDYPLGIERHFTIIDSNVNVDALSYQYRLFYRDTCGNISRSAYFNTSRTILLKANTTDNSTNIVTWNHYSGWLENVAGYFIFRSVDGVMNPQNELDIIPSNQSTYVDNSPELNGIYSNSEVCYYIVAQESAGNPVINNATAMSNTACVIKEPVFAVPNAFAPYSQHNYQFRPVMNQSLLQKYNMLIYNKWGQQIFESNSPTYGWNGMYKGQLSPSDVYIYVITYTSDTGKEYTKRGTFLLLN